MTGTKTPLAVNTSIALDRNADAKDAVFATGAPVMTADNTAIWNLTAVNLGLRQSVVGTIKVLKRYMLNNLGVFVGQGQIQIWVPFGGTEGDVVVGVPAATDSVSLVVGSYLIDEGRSNEIDESVKQLIDVWLEATTGN
jgi:hypothetical protein